MMNFLNKHLRLYMLFSDQYFSKLLQEFLDLQHQLFDHTRKENKELFFNQSFHIAYHFRQWSEFWTDFRFDIVDNFLLKYEKKDWFIIFLEKFNQKRSITGEFLFKSTSVLFVDNAFFIVSKANLHNVQLRESLFKINCN
jgi:hypothetical protein